MRIIFFVLSAALLLSSCNVQGDSSHHRSYVISQSGEKIEEPPPFSES